MPSWLISVESLKSSPIRRTAWLDLCRVAAMFGVVLIHSSAASFYQYGKIPLENWLSANFLDSLVRCSVPLFVMISGALLLKPGAKPVTFSTLARRLTKVLVPLLMWSVIYLLFISYHSGMPVDWLSILKQPAMYHLWFVYMIIGIYIFLPVFQVLFDAILTRRYLQLYLLGIWLVVTCLPVYCPLPLLSILQQTCFFGYGGYFLMGAVVASSPTDRIPISIWLLIFFTSVSVTFGLTWRFSEQAGAPIEKAYLYFSPNVFVSAVAAFNLISRARLSKGMAKSLQWISERSFLIYFVHVLALGFISDSSFISAVSHRCPLLLTILMISVATFVLSLMAAAVIRLVPGAQRVFG